MNLREKLFVEVRKGTKVTLSESDLNKMDRMYERELAQYDNRKVMTPYRKEPKRAFLAQLRDYAFERILDRHLYTFSHVLVIPNPYGVAKQTALILFNSSKEYKVRYRVFGDNGNDFVGESSYTTRHRVAILGLYFERSNTVDLSLIDREGKVVKHRVIRIFVSEVPENQKDLVMEVEGDKSAAMPLLAVNGAAFSPLVFDADGAIRYSMQLRTYKMGMIPMPNGHVLLADRTANIVNSMGKIQPCRYHEMDYMGRVYRTYLLEYRIGRAITQHGDSLFFVTASDDGHLSDRIAELNLKTGELIKYCDIHSIVGDKYRVYDNWIDTSNIEYNDGRILITAKRLNSIISIDWKELKPDWIIAPPKVWQDSDVSKYVLKDKSEHREGEAVIPVCSFPEYTSLMEDNGDKKKIVLFDIRNVVKYDGKVIVPGGKRSTKNSMVKIIDIDEKDMSYRVSEQTEVLSSLRFSRVIHSEDEKYLLVAQGYLREQTDDVHSIIQEIDADTGEKLHGSKIRKVFSSAWIFAPDIKEFCISMEKNDNVIFGKLNPLEKFAGELPVLSKEKTEGYYFGHGRICDELFLCNMRPGAVDRIYFIGEHNAYVKDMENVAFKDKKESFAIPLKEFAKDEYHVYVEYNDEVHKLKNEIRIVK